MKFKTVVDKARLSWKTMQLGIGTTNSPIWAIKNLLNQIISHC